MLAKKPTIVPRSFSTTLWVTEQTNHSTNQHKPIMTIFFKLCASIRDYNLAQVLRNIAFLPVLVYICYRELIDCFSQYNLTLHFPELPQPFVSPLAGIATELNSLTAKQLREQVTAPARTTKPQLIAAIIAG